MLLSHVRMEHLVTSLAMSLTTTANVLRGTLGKTAVSTLMIVKMWSAPLIRPVWTWLIDMSAGAQLDFKENLAQKT